MTVPSPTQPSVWRLTLLHTRFAFLETARVPIAVIGSLVFPTLAYLFFVVPMRQVAENQVLAT
ncbi:MAG: hypothetical protein ACRDT8_20650 [Micromonosporaceae bacterium]